MQKYFMIFLQGGGVGLPDAKNASFFLRAP